MYLVEKKLPEALQEATSVALAPDSAQVNATMGNVLDAMDRRVEARPYYETALRQALTVQPDFQGGLASFSSGDLRRKTMPPKAHVHELGNSFESMLICEVNG